jgi:hypothetical protein
MFVYQRVYPQEIPIVDASNMPRRSRMAEHPLIHQGEQLPSDQTDTTCGRTAVFCYIYIIIIYIYIYTRAHQIHQRIICVYIIYYNYILYIYMCVCLCMEKVREITI